MNKMEDQGVEESHEVIATISSPESARPEMIWAAISCESAIEYFNAVNDFAAAILQILALSPATEIVQPVSEKPLDR